MPTDAKKMRPLFNPLPWWGWVLAVLLGGMVQYTAVETKADRPLTGLQVEVAENYGLFTREDIEEKVTRFLGRPVSAIKLRELKLGQLEDYLDKNPFIARADAYTDSGHKLFVRVEMRRPVVRLMDYNGNSQFMDTDGVIMPIQENYSIRVPVVTGMHQVRNTSEEEAAKWLEELRVLALAIQQDSFMRMLTEQIHLNDERDFVIVPKLGRERIIVGDASDLEEKFEKLKLFYREGIRRTGFGKYQSINLKIKDQVIGKLKNT